MFPIPEQLSEATKETLEAQFALYSSLTHKTFEGVEKIFDLNLNIAKTSLEESNYATKQLLATKDWQEFMAATVAQAQPTAEKALAYSRHLATIATATQAEFAKAAEMQIAKNNSKVVEFINKLTEKAPPGSETAIAFLKSAIGNASAVYEQVTKSTLQAREVLDANMANMDSVVTQFSQAAKKTVKK